MRFFVPSVDFHAEEIFCSLSLARSTNNEKYDVFLTGDNRKRTEFLFIKNNALTKKKKKILNVTVRNECASKRQN